VTRIVASATSP